MAEKLIKSVRIRPRYDNETFELKISLFEDGKSRILKCSGFRAWPQIIYKTQDFSGYTNDDFIFQYIEDNKVLENRQLVDITYNQHLGTSVNSTDAKYRKKYGAYNPPFYEIVEDPYKDGPGPIKRSYGFDSYFLNNGAKIQIKWLNGFNVVGGVQFSDNFGRESDPYTIGQIGLGEKSTYVKGMSVYPPASATGSVSFTIADDEGFMHLSDETKFSKEWQGTKNDSDIITELLTKWRAVYKKNDLAVCGTSSQACPISVQYLDPVIALSPPGKTGPTGATGLSASGLTPSITVTNTVPGTTGGTGATGASASKPPKIEGIYTFDVTRPGYFINAELGELEIISKEEADINLVDKFIYQDDVEEQVSSEFTEVTFDGLEEVYLGPDPNAVDDVWDAVDLERGIAEESKSEFTITPSSTVTSDSGGSDSGGGGGGGSIDLPAARPETNDQKELIKYAVQSTGFGGPGKCARFTFNHANNYARAILKKDANKGATTPAGGNANQEGYHANLERCGYKRKDLGTLAKSELKKVLEDKSKWDIGDVVAYWGVANSDKSGVKYGHTQMYTKGYHGGKNSWTSDEKENFSCAFVYNKYDVANWRLITFKAPRP